MVIGIVPIFRKLRESIEPAQEFAIRDLARRRGAAPRPSSFGDSTAPLVRGMSKQWDRHLACRVEAGLSEKREEPKTAP